MNTWVWFSFTSSPFINFISILLMMSSGLKLETLLTENHLHRGQRPRRIIGMSRPTILWIVEHTCPKKVLVLTFVAILFKHGWLFESWLRTYLENKRKISPLKSFWRHFSVGHGWQKESPGTVQSVYYTGCLRKESPFKLQFSAFFLFSNFRKGRLLYICPVGWLVDVTINFFNI